MSSPIPNVKLPEQNAPSKEAKNPLEFKLRVINGMVEDIDEIAHEAYIARKKVDHLMQQWYAAKRDLQDYVNIHDTKPYFADLKKNYDATIYDTTHFYKNNKRNAAVAFNPPPK